MDQEFKTVTAEASTGPSPTYWMRLAHFAWYPTFVAAMGIFIFYIPRIFIDGPGWIAGSYFSNNSSILIFSLAWITRGVAMFAGLLSLFLGLLIFRRGSSDRMGLFTSFFLLAYGVTLSGSLDVFKFLFTDISKLTEIILPGFIALLTMFLFAIFPDGRFVPHWTRWVVLTAFLTIPLSLFWSSLYSEPPVDFSQPVVLISTALIIILMVAGWISILYAQVYRYRHISTPQQKQQTKWAVYGIGLSFSLQMLLTIPWLSLYALPPGSALPAWEPFASLIYGLWIAIIPVTLTIAVMRYRLYDIDIIINRTLVYGTLTVFVVGFYVLIVGIAGLVMQTNVDLAGLLITAILVGAMYRPLRVFLQTVANRFIPVSQHISGEIVSAPVSQTQQNQNIFNFEPTSIPSSRELPSILVRVTWWVVALLAFGFIAVGVQDRYAQLITVSPSANTLVGQLRPDEANALNQAGISVTFYAVYLTALDTLITLLFALIGLTLAWLRPKDRGALIVSLVLISGAMTAISVGMTHPRWHLVVTTVHAVWAASLMPTLFLFPNGQFVPRWTRWLAAIWLLYTVAWLIFPAISPPFGFSRGFTGSELPRNLWFLLWFGGGLASQIYRYRWVSNALERQQAKWSVFGIGSSLILFVLGVGILTLTQLTPMSELTMIVKLVGISIFILSTLVVPLFVGVSILRYKLFDINIIVNRTLVYSALTFIIVSVYILIVGAAGTLIQAQGNLLITLLATGLIAVLFQPLRERLQSGVNRLIYGERDDPIEALSRLGKQMEVALPSDQVLPSLVKTIAQTLKLPYVGITQKGRTDISFGQETDNPLSFPFTFQGETTGVLLASPRSPGESFSSAEMRLLQNLARQAGVVVRNAQLAADLQRSRQTLVTAREEERHRLRRDLHDGIGPTMAGLTLKLDAAKDMVSSNLESGNKEELEQAIQLLGELKTQTQETVQTIRHIVHALRPPSLDVLGLIPALQAHFGQVAAPRSLTIQMRTTPDHFPRLSAAVEVAAYRIVLEAITNVINHAKAETCEVFLILENSNLKMEIRDDGIGLPKVRKHGIGLDSMRERAEELGGRFELTSSPQGTRVTAEIPIVPEGNES